MNSSSSTSSSSSSSSPHQNWLGFSISMHTSHLCLFEAFNTSTPPTSVSAVDGVEEDHQRAADATDLSIFTRSACVGPKLEDFLGGGSTTASSQPPPPPPLPPPPPPSLLLSSSLSHHQFCAETPPVTNNTVSDTEIYESELKSIAASFLRGLSSTNQDQQHQQTDFNHKQHQQLVHRHHHPLAQLADQSAPRKAVDTFGQRTSIYRGVTRHRWTGRYEAHLWDNSCRREGQSRKGRQVYLGGYDKEEKAARAYDLAALKYWGPTTTTNFAISNYEKELEDMKHMTRQEFVASLRRKSSGFSRGASIYRGVTRHHQHGRWQARIGRVAGNKDLYLGTFSTQEEAAEAYDIAAIKFRGLNAVTNFDMSRYDVKSIANSNLPIGGMSSNKGKNSSDSASDTKSLDGGRSSDDRDFSSASSLPLATSTLNFTMPPKQDPTDYWSNIFGPHNTITQNILLPSPSTNPLNIAGSSTNGDNNAVSFNNNIEGQSSAVQLVTPGIGLSSNYEANTSYGSWIQPAKPTISMYQTPIFGME